MHILNLLSIVLWVVVAYEALSSFLHLKNKELFRYEVTAITLLLLCCLNITRSVISMFVDVPPAYSGQKLLEYFYIGSSVFQLLLCHIVLKYIKNKPNKNRD